MAEALHQWLPCVLQACEPWISNSDINAGMRWNPVLSEQLAQAHFGIVCLTKENLTSPWIHFEAGALSKSVNEANVCPYLLDIQPDELMGPLAQFQAMKADKEGTRKLIGAIIVFCKT